MDQKQPLIPPPPIPAPQITINIAERVFPLRLAHADLALAEFRSGVTIMDSAEFWDLRTASTYKFSLLLWAAILWFKPEIEFEDVRQYITFDTQSAVAAAVQAVLKRDVYPVMEKIRAQRAAEEAGGEDPLMATTGSASVVSPATPSA